MHSRSSSMTSRSSQSAFAPYFPKAEGPSSFHDSRSLPTRPRDIGPVFDSDLAGTPIPEFDSEEHGQNFVPREQGDDADLPPQQPNDFQDPYLMPSLTANERLRLTMLWYYTKDVLQDEDFLLRLQEKLDLVQAFMGWEFAIMGLVSENVFTRVVTKGLPLAILPRRESTCSHTINTPPGSVFVLPNMASDWRFKRSPHVEQGGLRSYAGTSLRCKADTGEDVALGSLCIASNSEQPPLSTGQQQALARFADMLAAEIVNRCREARRSQRHIMAELIASAQSYNEPIEVERQILMIITKIYPNAKVEIQKSRDYRVGLQNRPPISYFDVQDGLWEDAKFIDSIIIAQNHTKLKSDRTVRAIVFPCQTHSVTEYLVVASSDVQLVFDDVDSWFIERCALILSTTIQEGRLKEALRAKEAFLRGITHQLRTPIHGVLGSCELLAEELASRNMLYTGASGLSPSSVLNTIRDSGRELMSTVNNMLKLNRWAETGETPQPARLSNLKQIEAGIMYEVHQTIPEHELSQISILFENQLANDDSMIVMDLSLLKECVQALIVNALSYTEKGSVIVVISAADDYSSLTFDIMDTGCGIAPDDRHRIFNAYEKVDTHTRGAGLGLTLSAKIASAMNGSVTLVTSEQGTDHDGSHFRAEFRDPGFACSLKREPPLEAYLKDLPLSFHVIPIDKERPELVTHFASYLRHRGFEDAKQPDGAIIVITYTSDHSEFRQLVESVDSRQVAMCLIPAGASPAKLHGKHEVRFFSGPFLSTRLEEVITELDKVYQRLHSDPQLGETASGQADKTDAHRSADAANGVAPADALPNALLVDDNVVNLRIMRMYCEKRNIPYTTATDGSEATASFLSALKDDNPINLVLMDLQMPVCDGVVATAEIRRLENEHALAPSAVFMVTGQDSVTDKRRSFEAGANEFYVKPLSLKTLDRGIVEYFPAFAGKMDSAKKGIKT